MAHSADDSQAFVEKLWALRRVGEIIDEIDLRGKNQELVDELVALATKHGILTPYTSFLADETASIRDVASNSSRANFALDALELESGSAAFGQRLMKNSLQRAEQAPASGYGIAADSSAVSGLGGYGGGARPAAGPASSSAGRARGLQQPGFGSPSGATGSVTRPVVAEPSAEPVVVRSVLNVGKKTFFWRNDRWEDSVLTETQLKNTRKVKRFSSEYFDLSKAAGKDAAKYLAIEGKVIVVLGDIAYEF